MMMQSADVTINIIGWLLKATLEASAPLVLAALGGMFSERSGVVNIGLEGLMLISAATGAAGSFIFKNPWIGLLFGVGAGAALAAVHAIICVKYKGNHIVSGTGILLFAAGASALLLPVIWGREGVSDKVPAIPDVSIPGAMRHLLVCLQLCIVCLLSLSYVGMFYTRLLLDFDYELQEKILVL